MITKIKMAAPVALVVSLASATSAQTFHGNGVTNEVYASSLVRNDRSRTYSVRGREITAPPWSFACMTDHGPSPCGNHTWAYGNVN